MNQLRVQFNFTKEALERVDEMKRKVGAGSRAEVLRTALAIYDWVLTKSQQECQMAAIDKDGNIREVLSPFFTIVSKKVS